MTKSFLQDFRTIAGFLDHRTTADCVNFYYKTQKLDDFATVRRKQQLKKRRQQSDANRTPRFMGVGSTPAGAGVCDGCVENNICSAFEYPAAARILDFGNASSL